METHHLLGKAKKQYSIRLSEEEREHLQSQADKYTRGNLSLWLVLAGSQFKPTKLLIQRLKSK